MIDYLVSRFNIGANDSENITLLDEFVDYFPSYSDDKRYISLKSLLTIGESNITASVFMNQAGNNFYNEQNYTVLLIITNLLLIMIQPIMFSTKILPWLITCKETI